MTTHLVKSWNALSWATRLSAAAIAGVLVLAPVSQASAHSELIESTPVSGATLDKAPNEVQLVFGEPVQQQGGYILVSVRDTIVSEESTFAANENVATVQLVAAGQPGTYTVSFRVVSADGHIVSDKFEYEVVDASVYTSTDPTQTSSDDASQAAATSAPTGEPDGSNGSVVWVLGLGAIGIALVAAMIAVAVRGRRDRTD